MIQAGIDVYLKACSVNKSLFEQLFEFLCLGVCCAGCFSPAGLYNVNLGKSIELTNVFRITGMYIMKINYI